MTPQEKLQIRNNQYNRTIEESETPMSDINKQIDDFITQLAKRRAEEFFQNGRPTHDDKDFYDQQVSQFFGNKVYPNPADSPRDWPVGVLEEKERAEAIEKRNAQLREQLAAKRVAEFNTAYNTPASPKQDTSNAVNPSHYKGIVGELQYLEVMVEVLGVEGTKFICLGNVYKYLFRQGKKDATVQEIMKARWYLAAFINLTKYGKVFEPGNTKKEL